jgi:6-phosphofructokinase 1
MAAMSSGAEQAYLPEEGISLALLSQDVDRMTTRFAQGRSLFLVLRAEGADAHYTTEAITRVFEAEGATLFDVRQVVLGHVQQGGNPTPFDRVLATRLAAGAIDALTKALAAGRPDALMIGLEGGQLTTHPMSEMTDLVDVTHRRPADQWWLGLTGVTRDLAQEPTARGH